VVGRVRFVVDAATFVMDTGGAYLTGLSGLTAGPYYLSASTAGAITATPPAVAGHVSKPVFVADSATSGYVLILRGAVVGTSISPPVIAIDFIDFTTAEPVAPTVGDLYVNTVTGTGSTTVGQTFTLNRIYRWLGGPQWEETTPVDGWIAYRRSNNTLYTLNDGTTWAPVAGGSSSDTVQALTLLASTAWNVALGRGATLSITNLVAGTITLANPTGMAAGESYKVRVTNADAVNRTIAFDTAYFGSSGASQASILLTAGQVVELTFYTHDGTTLRRDYQPTATSTASILPFYIPAATVFTIGQYSVVQSNVLTTNDGLIQNDGGLLISHPL
jgi:hypothetical protein